MSSIPPLRRVRPALSSHSPVRHSATSAAVRGRNRTRVTSVPRSRKPRRGKGGKPPCTLVLAGRRRERIRLASARPGLPEDPAVRRHDRVRRQDEGRRVSFRHRLPLVEKRPADEPRRRLAGARISSIPTEPAGTERRRTRGVRRRATRTRGSCGARRDHRECIIWESRRSRQTFPVPMPTSLALRGDSMVRK